MPNLNRAQSYAAPSLLAALAMVMALAGQTASAKPSVAITRATWSADTLSVNGKLKNSKATSVDLYDSSGRPLGQATVDDNKNFALTRSDLDRPDLLCSVLAKTGDASGSAVVKGREKSCAKAPACKIVSPLGSVRTAVNTDIAFKAKTGLKDKSAKPLRMEWDFAGGAMGVSTGNAVQDGFRRATGPSAKVRFVRDNTRYRVRFTAWDRKNRYCEDSVEVIVGTPPDTATEFQDTAGTVKAMAQTAQQARPKATDNLAGKAGDKVVVPFEKRSLQCGHDTGLLPYAPFAYPFTASTINAYVYEKALQPIPQTGDNVEVRYSAASSTNDPVGPNSINSTSRNWPVEQTASEALLKKGQLFERYERPPGANLGEGYYSYSQIDAMTGYYPVNEGMHQPVADEGPYASGLEIPINADHGRYMPGIQTPYGENTPQPFSDFVSTDNWFSAFWLPLTDIDDGGRVNPTPLFRIEAVDKTTQTPIAATDLAVTSGRDFHCRECHALGKIGANPDIARVNSTGETTPMLMAATGSSLEEEEQAALMNMDMLHAFWDFPDHHMPGMDHDPNAVIYGDGPGQCAGGPGMCHSAVTYQQIDQGYIGRERPRTDRGTMSNAMHRMHGTLQYNADRTDILREDDGSFRCKQDYAKTNCSVDHAKSLFPVKDAKGKILPMEENCLKCHSGEREQCYRDRMYTAGVTCYQCHGDMLAVAELYEKSHKNPDGNAYRMQWLDQPDCGSCHTGSGNRGKNAKNGFFSAGVKTLAFAADDPSATPNPVDLANPDERRFAVMPLTALPQQTAGYSNVLRTPLYRMGKDRHGQVACAACHGAAHSVWPNRDPNANDNVTALELQGHTGHLLECNVCHTADSFAQFADLDEGLKVSDRRDNVLGGPHNLHPVYDPNWWKSANGDTPNTDGSTSGGWHNDYAKLEGAAHEDQCAACHGNDHKGTRLSKTPVDRVFDFTDSPDLDKLKLKGIKPKVTVKAGSSIGCNTCHDVRLSCTGSPNLACGKASDHVTATTNQPPQLAQPYVIDATMGEPLEHTLTATDPEGDGISFGLAGGFQDFALDPTGYFVVDPSVFPNWISDIQTASSLHENVYLRSPFDKTVDIVVSDDRGGYAIQPITFRLDCPANSTWDVYGGSCGPLTLYSIAPYGILDAGPVWTHQVLAYSATGSKLTYTLEGDVAPGMSMDDKGYITWNTNQVPASDDYFPTIKVSDAEGNQTAIQFGYTVCKAPMHGDANQGICTGSVRITSTPPYTTSANSFRYQVVASSANQKAISYQLINAPESFTVSETGLVTGDPSRIDHGAGRQLDLLVQAQEAPDNWARQNLSIGVCQAATPIWDESQQLCREGPITLTTLPEPAASAHALYRSSATATDSNPSATVHFELSGAPLGMSIDGSSGQITWNTGGFEGESVEFGIIATDTQGGWGGQYMALNVCPGDQPVYDPEQGCIAGPIQFTTTPDYGVSRNGVFHYTAGTTNANNLPVTYSLTGAPPGASIDANGQLTWDTTGFQDGFAQFGIAASDANGAWTQQSVFLTVCLADAPTWDSEQFICVP